jgi:hypothetical protein
MYSEEKAMYIGFSTICSLRHPQTILEQIPHRKRGLPVFIYFFPLARKFLIPGLACTKLKLGDHQLILSTPPQFLFFIFPCCTLQVLITYYSSYICPKSF